MKKVIALFLLGRKVLVSSTANTGIKIPKILALVFYTVPVLLF
jgi:hypothetical protein